MVEDAKVDAEVDVMKREFEVYFNHVERLLTDSKLDRPLAEAFFLAGAAAGVKNARMLLKKQLEDRDELNRILDY